MRVIVFLVFSQIVFLGCSTTHIIKTDEQFILDKRGKLVLYDNSKIGVNMFYTQGDSIIVKSIRTRQEQHFHKSEMQQLVVTHRGKGGLRGGLILGAGSALLSYIYLKSESDEEGSITKEAAALIYGVWGGIVGVVGGILIGDKDIYIFENKKEPQRQN